MGTETAQEILTRDIMALGASLWPARTQTFDQARSLLHVFIEDGLVPNSTLGRRDNAIKIAGNAMAGVQFLHVLQFTLSAPAAAKEGIRLNSDERNAR